MDRDYSDKLALVYLLKSNPDTISCYQPNENDVLESFVIDKRLLIRAKDNEEKINSILSRCRNIKTKAREFCRFCQMNYLSSSSFPFNWNRGPGYYLVGDYDTTGIMPAYNELEHLNIILNWKCVEHVWHNDEELYPYETFASEWLQQRFLIRGDTYLPYEVKTSLNHSSICNLSHCFAMIFDPYYKSSDSFVEVAERWITNHPNELNIKDINNFRPIDIFNRENPDDRTYGNDEQQKYLVQQMRELLTPSE